MAQHHIRDNNGDLHFFNDEEYKQYKYRNGCLGVVALLVFVIGGLVSKCGGDGKSSSNTNTEEVISSEVHNTNDEDDNAADINMLMNEHADIIDNEETQDTSNDTEDNSTIQENVQEETVEGVTNEQSYTEDNEDSFSEDLKSLKKRQKEERKRLKQLEKEAKRKAKEEAKEAKRRVKEETSY